MRIFTICNVFLAMALLIQMGCTSHASNGDNPGEGNTPEPPLNSTIIELSVPEYDGQIAVEKALKARRSIRTYAEEKLSLFDISQILWAAQGITLESGGRRTAPSAGALYPLEIYLVAGQVDGLETGVYRYIPRDHSLDMVLTGDKRGGLAGASQSSVGKAAAVVIIAAVYERTESKYGQEARQYVHIEAGAVAQNVYLQSLTRGIGTVFVGAIDEAEVKSVLNLPLDVEPIGIMPLGKLEE